MANIIISRTANLDRPGNTEFLSGTLFADENLAHTFAISATRNGAEIALSGVVTACFIRPDGGTVELNGTIEDGKACVTLAESCYVVTGRFKLTVFVSVDGAKTAVYCAAGNVVETTTNTIIDPGSVVPSVDDIIAEYGTMQQAVEDCEDAAEAANTAASAADTAAANVAGAIADAYSATSTYAVGDYCTKDGKLYRCVSAISTAEAWTTAHWTEVQAMEEVGDLKSAIDNKVDKPLTLVAQDITLVNGYYTNTGGFISTSLYKAAKYAVEPGETLYLSGSGDVSKPAYLFKNTAATVIISMAEEALEMSDYKVTVPAGAGWVQLNSAGTNKTLAVKKGTIDTDFDINDIVSSVNTLSNNVTGLQGDVTTLENTAILAGTASNINFNNVDVNTVYKVVINTLIIVSNNVPYNYFTGTIITVGNSEGNVQQLAIGDNQMVYVRVKNSGSWTGWERIEFAKVLTALSNINLNTAKEKNISIEFSTAGTASTHVPVYGFQGAIFNVNDTNYGAQIAVDKNGKIYVRGKNNTSWEDWVELGKASDVDYLMNGYCILSEFDNITCLGDSLTHGSVYYGPGSAFRQAKKPYPEVLAVHTGATVANVSQSGIDPKTFVSSLLSNVTEKTNHLCIVYLGTNGGGLTDTIDTDASGTDKSQYDLTTQTGAYCYIVKYCIDIGARVLLVKCHAASATTNEVIGKVAEKFTVAAIENDILPHKYRLYLNGSGADSIHYNDFGYAAFADYLIRQVGSLSSAMTVRLFPYPVTNA